MYRDSTRHRVLPGPSLPLLAFILLLLQLSAVVKAGSNPSKLCGGLWCYSDDDNGADNGQNAARGAYSPKNTQTGGIECFNPDAPKKSEDWGIAKLNRMPTVEEFAADIRACGIANSDKVNAFFSSFGGGKKDREKYRESAEAISNHLNLKHITDIMPEHWTTILQKFGGTHPDSPEQKLWNMRLSQAFAKVAVGDVYCVTSGKKPTNWDRDLKPELGEFMPATIYSHPFVNQANPWMGSHNVWYDQEFHTLQQNPKVRAIYTIVNTNLKEADKTGAGAWIRNPRHGGDAPYFLDADRLSVEQLRRLQSDFNKLTEDQKGAIKTAHACTPGLDSLIVHAKRTKTTSPTRKGSCLLLKGPNQSASSKTTTSRTRGSSAPTATSKGSIKPTSPSAKTTKSSSKPASTPAKSRTSKTSSHKVKGTPAVRKPDSKSTKTSRNRKAAKAAPH